MTNERHHPATRILVAAVVSVWAMAWAPGALAAGAGIAGTVVNGTTDDPVAGLEVTLHLLTQQRELGTLTATTDTDGAFSFPAPSAGAERYQVTATYKGVVYRSQATQITQGEPVAVTLSVYETTPDPADVRQTSWIIWIDREGGGAAVQHDLEWKNSGTAAYVGDQTASDGSQIVTQLSLAPGASNLQFLGTYLETPGQVVGSVFVHPQPIVPGTSTATLRYSVADLTELRLPVTLPTDKVQLFVPTGVEVVPTGLTPAGTYSDQGNTYQVFTATGLKGGETLGVTLKGLVGGGPSPLLFVIVGTVVVAVIGALAIWRLGRRREVSGRTRSARRADAHRPVPGRKAARRVPAEQNGRRTRAPARSITPDTRRAGVAGTGGGASEEVEGEDEFDLLIEEIAALDLSYERGLLEQRTYESLRAAAKRRLQRMRGAPTEGRPAR